MNLFCGPSPKVTRVEKWKINYRIVDNSCCFLRIMGDDSVFAKRKTVIGQVVSLCFDDKERVIQVDTNSNCVFKMGFIFEKKIEFEKLADIKKVIFLMKQCLF